MTDMTTEERLAHRAARLLATHEPAGLRLARQRVLTSVCGVPDCDAPGVLMARGRRCVEHRPLVPTPGPPTRPSPDWTRRAPEDYGTATADPLGRDAPGWAISRQTGLPVRVAA